MAAEAVISPARHFAHSAWKVFSSIWIIVTCLAPSQNMSSRWHSKMQSLSSCAIATNTVSINCPCGVVVSMDSFKQTKSAPFSLSSSARKSKSFVLRFLPQLYLPRAQSSSSFLIPSARLRSCRSASQDRVYPLSCTSCRAVFCFSVDTHIYPSFAISACFFSLW